jgi:hypothetical protein
LSNTTQFSRGRMVLRSGGPNHVNLGVHRVHLYLATKRPKPSPTKEPQQAAPIAAPVEISQTHFDRFKEGNYGVCNMGCYNPPPLKEISSRDLEREGQQGSKEHIRRNASLARWKVKMIGMRTLSVSKVACTVSPFYVMSCDLNGISLGWLLRIGRSNSNGITILTTALWCPHTTSLVGIYGNIVNLGHLVWYMHLTAVGQLLWLKRYRSKT